MESINKAMKNLKGFKNKLEEDLLYEMANIQPRTTGLKAQLYATFDGKSLVSHGPRVKVRTADYPKGFPIIIDRKLNKVYPLNKNGEYDKLGKDKVLIDEAIKYVENHKEEFIAHWNALIGDEQLRRVLRGDIILKDAIEDAKENGTE